MKLRVGQTLRSTVDGTALVVVRCPADDLTVTCGGRAMTDEQAPAQAPALADPGAGALLGKRYTADGVDIELLCVQPGTHPVAVNGAEVAQKTAKPLPASD
ncbi:hypothetical protein LO762_27720 [Actinocorallia sp. API 0066]|uniref:hypothetical protein n=1 Tax=Actinocorallia sp. API 0066 TaxID=2896846 RepID=UPI001E3CFFB9|nr:hypothetical protein [Actinocorallia sp. API 0066]MCD0452940.1 hypothetical protein [Actinocorallia sp. API 0066]